MKLFKYIIFIFLVIISIVGIIFLRYKIEDNKLRKNIKKFSVEVYSDKSISDLLSEYDVINNKKINTNKIGNDIFKCYCRDSDGNKKKMYVSVDVVDTTPPLVWLNEELNVFVGTEDKLIDTILCGDNYDKRPKCKIVGDYNLNKLGSYKLLYTAKDSSSNETNINFTLNVVEKTDYVESKTLFSDVIRDYPNKNIRVGIDVSSWQEDIDFKKVKNSGASFVMIRVGYQNEVNGKLSLDKYFNKNIEEALNNGLDVGIYFYSKASSIKEVYKQAEFVYKNIKDYNVTLPVVFDWEIYSSFNSLNISLKDLNSISDVFINKMNGYGYKATLYGSKNYLEKLWDVDNKSVWLAHYTDKTNYSGKYFMWQLCNDGVIDGTNGFVDIDILYENRLQ